MGLFENELLALRPWALKFTLSLTRGNSHNAEDVVQDAMIRALQSQENYTGCGVVRNYLARIIIATHIIHHRRRQGRRIPDRETLIGDMGDRDFAYEDPAFAAVDAAACIAHLSPEDQELLFIRESGGTYIDLAKARGVHRQTLSTRRNQIVAKLRMQEAA